MARARSLSSDAYPGNFEHRTALACSNYWIAEAPEAEKKEV